MTNEKGCTIRYIPQEDVSPWVDAHGHPFVISIIRDNHSVVNIIENYNHYNQCPLDHVF